jgi:hypothetical protein
MTDKNDQAKTLMRRVVAEVERFLDELTPEQLAALEDGTATCRCGADDALTKGQLA